MDMLRLLMVVSLSLLLICVVVVAAGGLGAGWSRTVDPRIPGVAVNRRPAQRQSYGADACY